MTRVPLDVACYEQYEDESCQDPEGAIEVRVLRILWLEVSVEWDEAAAHTLAHCFRTDLKEGGKRGQRHPRTPLLELIGLFTVLRDLLFLV